MPRLLCILKPAVAAFFKIRHEYQLLRLQHLIARGLIIGKNVYINMNVSFDTSHPYLIEIQDNCRISSNVRFLTHDATAFRRLGVTRVAKVRILEGTFIGERAIILPGVTIGPNALIAAGAVVNRDVGEDMCAAGNPARPYGKLSKLLERYCKQITEDKIFDLQAFDNGDLTIDQIRRLCDIHGTIFFKGLHKSDPHYINLDVAALEREQRDAFANLWHMKASLAQSLEEDDYPGEGNEPL